MLKYIIKRIILLVPIIVIVAVIAFLITNIMPGDPVRVILGNFATEELITSDLLNDPISGFSSLRSLSVNIKRKIE